MNDSIPMRNYKTIYGGKKAGKTIRVKENQIQRRAINSKKKTLNFSL